MEDREVEEVTVPTVSECPICGEAGGFHDYAKHNQIEVPKDDLVDPAWWKEFFAEFQRMKQERKPRVWKLTPLPPPDVKKLRGPDGQHFVRDEEDPDGWFEMNDQGDFTLGWYSWSSLIFEFEELTEVL